MTASGVHVGHCRFTILPVHTNRHLFVTLCTFIAALLDGLLCASCIGLFSVVSSLDSRDGYRGQNQCFRSLLVRLAGIETVKITSERFRRRNRNRWKGYTGR